MTNIYVGNLLDSATEDDLRQAFSQHGEVSDVNIIKDRETGRCRGFAFIEMPNGDEATNAIKQLDLYKIDGRSITVNEARPRKPNRPRKSGGTRRAR